MAPASGDTRESRKPAPTNASASVPGALSETVIARVGSGVGMRPISRTSAICSPMYGLWASVDQTRVAKLLPVFKKRRMRVQRLVQIGHEHEPEPADGRIEALVREFERRCIGDLRHDIGQAGRADGFGGGREHAGRDVGGQQRTGRADALRGQHGLIAGAGRHIQDAQPGPHAGRVEHALGYGAERARSPRRALSPDFGGSADPQVRTGLSFVT